MFKKKKLANGLRLITAPMKGTNTVTALVVCATGSDHEPKGKNGISHFLEHMFFKGTKRRPTPQRIMQETDTMGSITNAFTTHEYTGYFVKAGKMYLDQSLDLLADIYQNSIFPEREIAREKQVVVEELQNERDTPSSHVWRIWEKLLYGDQPAGWEIGGDEADIRGFSRRDLLGWFDSRYSSRNTALVIAGNFDESRAALKAERLFGNLRSASPRAKVQFNAHRPKKPLVVQTKKTDQSHLLLGFPAYPKAHPDRYIVDLLETLVGGGNSSRMMDQVRERSGLAYAIYSYAQTFANRGYFVTYAGVSHRNLEKAIRVMRRVYQSFMDKPVPLKELERAKDHYKGTALIQLESSNAMANFLGVEEIETGSPLTPDDLFGKIDLVTARDIQRVSRDIFRPQNLRLALIGPHAHESRLEKTFQPYDA